jgi:hypothetical protein
MGFKRSRLGQARLDSKYGVTSIPTLILLDAITLKLITLKGRDGVTVDPTVSLNPYDSETH